jgi:putative membrane protein
MSDTESAAHAAGKIDGDSAVELSSNRTSLSFERTRMSADRTLMSIVRTSLSLISFGFTIYETFHQLAVKGVLETGTEMARRLGVSLLVLGILMLAMGIVSHARFGRQLTARRGRLFGMGLLHTDLKYQATPTFAVAFLLLLIGLTALASIAFRLLD